MYRTSLFAFSALFALSTAAPPKPFAVAGYLPEWRYLQWTESEHKWRWDAIAAHVTQIILFSIEVSPDGSLTAMDRFPPAQTLKLARKAANAHGSKLLICLGGNGRSNGFSTVVASEQKRRRLVRSLVKLCDKHSLQGVDFNWEYPSSQQDWEGLFKLLAETRRAFQPDGRLITMAYYPDGRQEKLLAQANVAEHVDFMHMMSYDAPGGKHSTWEFGKQSVEQGMASLPAAKLTMGLPCYARDTRTGDWTSYEDVVKQAPLPLDPGVDQIGTRYFNGASLIKRKTAFALEKIGGVMIWELGQDHFVNEISALGEHSLLKAITEVLSASTDTLQASRSNAKSEL